MTVEDQLREALAAEAAAVPEPMDRWAEVEARAAGARRVEARRRARGKTAGITMLALAATTVAALVALPAITHQPTRRVAVTPGHPATTAATRTTPTTPSTATAGSTVASTPPTAPPVGFAYQPLYPFRSLAEATAWETSYQAGGAQPWHLDPGQTALSFAGFLGYTDVTTVFGVRTDTTGAHVSVGFPNPNGAPVTSAVVHLRRFGTGALAPWEVVGTDDTANFSLTVPRYGATATSPLTVGGAIVGVDESVKVQVLQVSSPSPLGVFCCLPAGNSGAPWTTTVTFRGATDDVVIVAASTGGHVAAVERFTVTAARTRAGAAPGL